MKTVADKWGGIGMLQSSQAGARPERCKGHRSPPALSPEDLAEAAGGFRKATLGFSGLHPRQVVCLSTPLLLCLAIWL